MKRTALPLLASLLALAACARQPMAYPPEFEENFRSACEVDHPPAGYCDCVLAKLEAQIPPEEMAGLDQASSNGRPHPLQARIEAFGGQCLNQGPS